MRDYYKAWFVFSCVAALSKAFVPHGYRLPTRTNHANPKLYRPFHRQPVSSCHLVPVSTLKDDLPFLAECVDNRSCINSEGIFVDEEGEVYELCLAEEGDLPDVANFVVKCFGADLISLSRDMSSLERLIMKPAVELVNGYSGIVAFAEVLAGLRSRLSERISEQQVMDLSPPNLRGLSRTEKLDIAMKTSLVLAVAKKHKTPGDWHIDVIASVELRLQPCDAKIPFSLPWLDRIERRLASFVGLGKSAARDLQPYLSNLCVDPKYRGRRLGRALVQCVENIASSSWGYKRMYLHVDVENEAALGLYKSEGYRDVGLRWKPFWAGRAADIGYFVKNLVEEKDTSEKEQAIPTPSVRRAS